MMQYKISNASIGNIVYLFRYSRVPNNWEVGIIGGFEFFQYIIKVNKSVYIT